MINTTDNLDYQWYYLPYLYKSLIRYADYFKKLGWHKPLSQFLTYIDEEIQGIRTNFVGAYKGVPTGYITILWESDHPYFSEHHIPEIKDLNVFPEHRNHGLALHYFMLVKMK